MAHTTEFAETQNFTKCFDILNEFTENYTQFLKSEILDSNKYEEYMTDDQLKLYDYCGQNLREWIDDITEPGNYTIYYFSKRYVDIINKNNINIINIKIKNYSKSIKFKYFAIPKQRDESIDKNVEEYKGSLKPFLNDKDIVILKIFEQRYSIYNGCRYVYNNLFLNKLDINILDNNLLSVLNDMEVDEKYNEYDSILAEIENFDQSNEFMFQNLSDIDRIYTEYFKLLFDYNDFDYMEFLLKKLPTSLNYIDNHFMDNSSNYYKETNKVLNYPKK